MKKLTLSLAFAFIACSVFAQQGQSNSQGECRDCITKNQSDQSTIYVQLCLDNLISLSPGKDWGYTHFKTKDDYNHGKYVKDISEGDDFDFTVFSNKKYDVTVKGASANFSSSSSTPMPISVLKWKVNTNLTGGTAAGGWNTMSTVPATAIDDAPAGANKKFSLGLFADPGWSYEGGSYNAAVLVTATQE